MASLFLILLVGAGCLLTIACIRILRTRKTLRRTLQVAMHESAQHDNNFIAKVTFKLPVIQ